MSEQIALKFPDGTRARLKSLARPGETMTATLIRALGLLAGAPSPAQDAIASPDLLARVEAIEARLDRFPQTAETDQATEAPRTYQPAERFLALLMQQQGRRSGEIRRALLANFGRAPGPREMSKALRRWSSKDDSAL